MDSKKHSFSSFFTEGHYQTQVETLEISKKDKHISIGIPKETIPNENRISLVPNSIRSLIGYGHRVIVQSGAGEKSKYSDHDFSEAGAEIAEDARTTFECDVVVKAAPPTVEELAMFKSDQMLISPLHFPIISEEYLQTLKKKRITAIAMEYMQAQDGSFPIVRILSEMAGTTAMLLAAELMSNTNGGRGVLLGSVSGVPPAKVVILGAGIVGENACRIANGLGASIRLFDNDINKLMRLQNNIGRQLHTSSINPVYLAYQLTSADVVIGAIHSKTGRSPVLVTEEMVSKMKEGAVIIDVSIDQGGCFETSRITSHDNPTFVKHDVVHYCVPNIASKIPRTASQAVSNILTPILLRVGTANSFDELLYHNHGLRHGVYTYKGCLTNEYLAQRYNMYYTVLDLLLTSSF